jgi:hypothetical protein
MACGWIKSDVAHAMTTENSNARTDRIDAAVSAGGELVGALIDLGPINPEQAKLIVEATVRAAVPNAEDWEVRESAARIATELEGRHENHSDNV